MNKKLKCGLISTFIAFEIACLLIILLAHGKIVTAFSFLSTSTAFLFSMLFLSISKKEYLIQVGLFFTMIADIFLVLISPRNQAIAMTSFSITQLAYFIKILLQHKNKTIKLIHILTRCVAIIGTILTTILILKEKTDYISLISMFYYANLILNTIFAFINIKKNPLLAIGLTFFLLCDTIIGIRECSSYINIPESFYQIAHSSFNWAWLFYVISQTLIALSVVIYKKQKKEKNNEII